MRAICAPVLVQVSMSVIESKFSLNAAVVLKFSSLPVLESKSEDKMASDSPRRPSRCAGGVLVRAQAAT